jgi:uncharacterized protein (PEP-CTERM system associated)
MPEGFFRAHAGPSPARGAGLAMLVAGLAGAGPAPAGEWELTPRIRVSETYTDNVTLAESGGEAEYITQVNPGLRLEGQGRRAELGLNYQMQNLFYTREPDRNSTYHQMGADGQLELLRRTLFVQADATRTQQILDATGTVPSSNLGISGARENVTTYGGGPLLKYALGSFAGARARYRADRVDYGDGDRNSTQHTTDASLTSGPRFNRVGWSLSYERREETIDRGAGETSDSVLQRGRGELNVQLGARTQVFGAGGYEENEYPQALGQDPPEGSFWEAGLRWNPTRRTSLQGSYGERYFGETWSASFSHQGPELSMDLSYSENLVTQTELQFQRSQALVRDADGNLVLDPDGDPVVIEFAVPTLANEVFIQKRARAGVGWQAGPTRLGLSAFNEDREYQTRDQDEEAYGGSAQLDWDVAMRTDLELSGRWQKRTFATLDRTDTWWSARTQVRRRMADSMDVSASYEFVARDSDQGGQDYEAHTATVALTKTF